MARRRHARRHHVQDADRIQVRSPSRAVPVRSSGSVSGLSLRKYQFGETNVTGGIAHVGDDMVRTAFYAAANAMLTRGVRML